MDNKSGSEYRTVRGYQIVNYQENKLTPAMEDYMEMACRLCLENGYTRINKLAELLNVRPSSASKMIAKLSELGYLQYDLYESILLTEKGKETGTYLLYRHNTVEQFLRLIGNNTPLEETELIEHSLNVSTVLQLHTLLNFFAQNVAVQESFETFKKAAKENPASPGL